MNPKDRAEAFIKIEHPTPDDFCFAIVGKRVNDMDDGECLLLKATLELFGPLFLPEKRGPPCT